MARVRSISLARALLLPRLAVAVEALRVAERGGDVRVVHRGRRLVARALQHAGERGVEVQEERVALAVAGLRGEAPRHHRDEAAARLGPVRVGLVEDDAPPAQRVHPGAGRPPVAVGAQVVGAQGVDRDQEHVEPVPGRDRPRALRLLRGPLRGSRAAATRRRRQDRDRRRQGAPHAASSITIRRTSSPPWCRCTRTGALHGRSRSRSAHSTARTPSGPGSSSRPISRSSPVPRRR